MKSFLVLIQGKQEAFQPSERSSFCILLGIVLFFFFFFDSVLFCMNIFKACKIPSWEF